jgi:hypothetical protein
LSTSGLSPGSSTTFEIVTGPSSTGQVTDTVTIHFESSSDLSVDVTRDITVDFNASNTSVVASPAGPNQTAEHTWKAPGYTTGGPEVNTIALDYSGTGTNFGNVNSGNVTVTLTRTLSSGLDRSTINVTSGGSSFGGETALIDLSGTYTTDVVDDPNGNPNVKLAVANVGNPSSAGVFQATIDFNLSNGTTDSFDAELEIVNTPRFDVTITSAPNEIFKGDTFDIEYEVANNGTKPDTQDIELAINGVVEQTNGSVNLNANQTLSAKTGNTPTFTLNESNLSQSPPYSIEIKSADTTASQVVSVVVPNDFSLTANPTTPNTSSTHTWKATETDFTGEVDTITVDYPSGFDFSGLNETDITVTMERQLGSGPSTDNIPVNSGTYSGTSATFDLSGYYNTDLIGLLEVEIAGITNASTGTYSPTITLNGANDTVSDTIGALDIQ